MRRLAIPGVFGFVAVLTAAGAVNAVVDAVERPGLRLSLIALYHVLRTAVAVAFSIFTYQRAEPHHRARDPLTLAVCLFATFALVLLTVPNAHDNTALVLAGDAIAVASCAWLLYAVLGLGRCFGVLPEARGLVTDGAYRVVRHPVYLGELGAYFGLALAAPTAWNALLVSALTIAQLIRMRLEERALTLAFPDYSDYAAGTPRILPRASLAIRAVKPRRRWSTV